MRIFVVVAALAVAACADQPAGPSSQAAAASNCDAAASSPWDAGGEIITVEASAAGADCVSAQATITLRRADGAAIFAQTFSANQIMVLAGAVSVADMERRLQEWVSPPGAAPDSTGDLPEWAPGGAHPGESEFPFHPYGDMDRAAYAALRATDAAMFCFVQGMESQACFWLDAGALRRIGEQRIPG